MAVLGVLAASWWADSKNIVNEATGCANDNKAFDSPPSKKMFSMFVSRCRSLFAVRRYMCFAFFLSRSWGACLSCPGAPFGLAESLMSFDPVRPFCLVDGLIRVGFVCRCRPLPLHSPEKGAEGAAVFRNLNVTGN